jgi:hypothetical protein
LCDGDGSLDIDDFRGLGTLGGVGGAEGEYMTCEDDVRQRCEASVGGAMEPCIDVDPSCEASHGDSGKQCTLPTTKAAVYSAGEAREWL